MLTIQLQGGLGNQLFQLAFLEYASAVSGKEWYISNVSSPATNHSSENYYETIFKNWKQFFDKRDITQDEVLLGYFQDYKFTETVKDTFISRLSFNETILEKYPDISKKVFIHIRGGDYKNNSFHDVGLTNYYKKCIEECSGSEFIVFTNDIPYAKQFGDYPIIEENEVDTLFLMSKCSGCICANSSFSWWGAYLNPKRRIFIPSKWVNGVFHHETYRVPGWIVI